MGHLIVQISLSFIGTIAFGLFIQVPKNQLCWTGLAGCLGWTTYWLLIQIHVGSIPANFVGAFVVGIIGLILSRIRKQPSTVFNIPGLVPLVPGASAYQALEKFMSAQRNVALEQCFHVLLITGAIALGYVLAQLLGELWFAQRHSKS
ncbi:threonine/serine exporter family protein [Bombilactobacillus folatiphilus]|uniref:Threonine/serine exporter family protein n=1 Tax=Bombilactobacillus folatiphilus TaxID=2923362 RepID=A0ABY4P8M6_9LACO|nr:threonine/serine exporter family protein [Bombilactobacillus folatiphilus]UQS82063.1 threonine/serine exporter family protein [Bombilactobacillus folatiphilus]